MKISLHLHNKALYRVILLILINFASQTSLASSMAHIRIGAPISMLIELPQGGFSFCSIDGSCQTIDASWVKWQLPYLQVGEETSISTTSSSFGFYLGNSLAGQINVSVTPVFQLQSNTNFVDELTANIADQITIFSITHNGIATFEAVSGTNYYLLLSGKVRGETTYQLQLSQVPLPATFYLFGSGLMLLLTSWRNRNI